MNKDQRKILLLLAEEAIYSAKGHFKTADWVKISLACYIFVPLVTSLLLLFFIFSGHWQKLLSFFGFLFSSLTLNSSLNSNRDKASKIIGQHFDLGNKYLEIFKLIRNFNFDAEDFNSEKLNEIQKNITSFDMQTKNLPISIIGRWWAKLRIKREVDLSWIYKR